MTSPESRRFAAYAVVREPKLGRLERGTLEGIAEQVIAEHTRRTGLAGHPNPWLDDVCLSRGGIIAKYLPDQGVWEVPAIPHLTGRGAYRTWYAEGQQFIQHPGRPVASYPIKPEGGLDPFNPVDGARAVHGAILNSYPGAYQPDPLPMPTRAIVAAWPYPLSPNWNFGLAPPPPPVGLAIGYMASRPAGKKGWVRLPLGQGLWIPNLVALGWNPGKKAPGIEWVNWRHPKGWREGSPIPVPMLAPLDWEAWKEWLGNLEVPAIGLSGGLESSQYIWLIQRFLARLDVALGGSPTFYYDQARNVIVFEHVDRPELATPGELSRALLEAHGTTEVPEPFATWIENGLGPRGKE